MKVIKQITIIFSFFISFWSVCQERLFQHAPNTTSQNLNGPVKEIHEKSFVGGDENGVYVILKAGWKTSWERDSKSYYDTSGHQIKKTFYTSTKSESRTEYFKYENDRLTESKMLYHHTFYEYDSVGRIQFALYRSSQPEHITTGNEIPIDKSSFNIIEYFYDQKDNLTAKIETDSEDDYQSIDSIFYDNKSNPIIMQSYYHDKIKYQTMQYDTKGRLILLSVSDNYDGVLERTKYQYTNGKISTEDWELFFENQSDGKVIYTYEDGNEIKTIESESDESISSIEESQYEFDHKGNWIRKTIVDSKGRTNIITRNIKYY